VPARRIMADPRPLLDFVIQVEHSQGACLNGLLGGLSTVLHLLRRWPHQQAVARVAFDDVRPHGMDCHFKQMLDFSPLADKFGIEVLLGGALSHGLGSAPLACIGNGLFVAPDLVHAGNTTLACPPRPLDTTKKQVRAAAQLAYKRSGLVAASHDFAATRAQFFDAMPTILEAAKSRWKPRPPSLGAEYWKLVEATEEEVQKPMASSGRRKRGPSDARVGFGPIRISSMGPKGPSHIAGAHWHLRDELFDLVEHLPPIDPRERLSRDTVLDGHALAELALYRRCAYYFEPGRVGGTAMSSKYIAKGTTKHRELVRLTAEAGLDCLVVNDMSPPPFVKAKEVWRDPKTHRAVRFHAANKSRPTTGDNVAQLFHAVNSPLLFTTQSTMWTDYALLRRQVLGRPFAVLFYLPKATKYGELSNVEQGGDPVLSPAVMAKATSAGHYPHFVCMHFSASNADGSNCSGLERACVWRRAECLEMDAYTEETFFDDQSCRAVAGHAHRHACGDR
jgi:hypothetical protein